MDSTTDASGILVEFKDGSLGPCTVFSGTVDGDHVRIYGEETSKERLEKQEKIVAETLLELTTEKHNTVEQNQPSKEGISSV